jgi:hypothetical protein
LGYEERMDAEGDYVSERAHEMFEDGDFDENIRDSIDGGHFDDECINRVIDLCKGKMGWGYIAKLLERLKE